MNDKQKAPEPGGKIRKSISNKLQSKLFFRLIGIFFSLNIMICIIAAVALALYSENKVIGALEMLDEHQIPVSGEWMEHSGLGVRAIPDITYGNWMAWPFSGYLPYETEIAYRGFRAEGFGFPGAVRSITYVVAVGIDDAKYEVGLRIGDFILYFTYCLLALMFIELLTLLSRTADDRKMIRKTLDPISDLARAAQSFSDVGKQLDQEKALALAGRLDRIDAGRLDTRIQVDDLQQELRSVAVAINGMLDRINQSYAAQARFVSDASHELRTPIAVIQGYANLLDRWGKEDEKALSESIAAIKDEAENMKELVEQLLFLARGESNRISLVEERIELDALIAEVVSETRMLDGSHEFKVSSGNVAVLADRALIKQALRILVDNAVKYTDQGGEITVSVSQNEGNARVSVADNGIGISPDILPYVFDRFVRADESRARATGGAGLGLSIAQWIAARHNGHMEVLSREGIGTRITIVLPAAIDEQVTEPGLAADLPPAPAQSPGLTLSPAPEPAPAFDPSHTPAQSPELTLSPAPELTLSEQPEFEAEDLYSSAVPIPELTLTPNLSFISELTLTPEHTHYNQAPPPNPRTTRTPPTGQIAPTTPPAHDPPPVETIYI